MTPLRAALAALLFALPIQGQAQDAATDAAAIRALSLYDVTTVAPFELEELTIPHPPVIRLIEIEGCLLHVREIQSFGRGEVQTVHQQIDLREVVPILPDGPANMAYPFALNEVHLIPGDGMMVQTTIIQPAMMSNLTAYADQPIDGMWTFDAPTGSAIFMTAAGQNPVSGKPRAGAIADAIRAYQAAYCAG